MQNQKNDLLVGVLLPVSECRRDSWLIDTIFFFLRLPILKSRMFLCCWLRWGGLARSATGGWRERICVGGKSRLP